MVTWELARGLCQASHEVGRQIGLIVDRRGMVRFVIVGGSNEIEIPSLDAFRLGATRLRGVRCIHTHLKDDPLTQDDMTDLALLRLDLMAAIGVQSSGEPGHIYWAHLLPPNPEGRAWEASAPQWAHELNLDFRRFVTSLEEELRRHDGSKRIDDHRERAILISVSPRPRVEQEESIEELRELARSADVVIVDTVIQRPKAIHSRLLLGEGRLKETIIRALQLGTTLLIFDQNLSPGQVKAIGDLTDLKVIDRTQLILDIFARRAHSREGKLQVELAQLQYRLPRLSERSTALSRLTGGIGGRGPGETKLEEDRRRTRDKILRLEKELEAVAQSRKERRAPRLKRGLPIISIVGYTNVGKSTLLNALTESHVLTDNLLFATLDTSTRRLRFPREREAIITDTVGFLRALPPDLMGAFRSTLDELQDAHLLLHVVDISNPAFEDQMEAVSRTLEDLGLDDRPVLLVLNKRDLIPLEDVAGLEARFGGVAVSAVTPQTLIPLLERIEKMIFLEPIPDAARPYGS